MGEVNELSHHPPARPEHDVLLQIFDLTKSTMSNANDLHQQCPPSTSSRTLDPGITIGFSDQDWTPHPAIDLLPANMSVVPQSTSSVTPGMHFPHLHHLSTLNVMPYSRPHLLILLSATTSDPSSQLCILVRTFRT